MSVCFPAIDSFIHIRKKGHIVLLQHKTSIEHKTLKKQSQTNTGPCFTDSAKVPRPSCAKMLSYLGHQISRHRRLWLVDISGLFCNGWFLGYYIQQQSVVWSLPNDILSCMHLLLMTTHKVGKNCHIPPDHKFTE